jgi:hypothetical protein
MTKVRKSPIILKPTIDEKMALQFASAVPPPASVSAAHNLPATAPKQPSAKELSSSDVGKNVRQISLTLKGNLYDKIARDAARKNRTIEEHLIKHLTKRYKK